MSPLVEYLNRIVVLRKRLDTLQALASSHGVRQIKVRSYKVRTHIRSAHVRTITKRS